MSVSCWISVRTRLPDMYVRVPTLLFNDSLVMNSVQFRNIREANAEVKEMRQWEQGNEQVTYWLDGVPEPPLRTPVDPPRPEKRIDIP